MCMEKTDWERAVEFHGHTCPGLAIGFRAAQLALAQLGESRAPDEEMVAIVENDACGVDAIQVLTGCTFGKGNLIFHDLGKHVYTFGQRSSNRAIRVTVRAGAFHNPEYSRLRRLAGTDMTAGDARRLEVLRDEHISAILAGKEDAFDIRELSITLPPKARIVASVTCYRCGESVMETRARVRDGKPVCIPCSEVD
ncbi:MAG TPA: FmdE family protein [Spirochaetia bacterium]|nr:FmdE family protein [Spirochaetia bacterium]